jgi:hypothetical protein
MVFPKTTHPRPIIIFVVIKNMKYLKQIFLIFLLFLCFYAISPVSAKETEVNYPKIGDLLPPTETRIFLPDYIKYIFSLALWISGIIVFGVIIWSGFRFVISSGNPNAANEARENISAALIGLVILLSSYLLLTTINPSLVIVNPSANIEWGIVIYKNSNCSGDDFKKIANDTPDLEDFDNTLGSIKFLAPKGYLDIYVYSDTDYEPNDRPNIIYSETADKDNCAAVDPKVGGTAHSLRFKWNLPGVYLVNDSGKEMLVTNDMAFLPANFDNKIKAIKFVNTESVKYGAILYDKPGFKGGECQVYVASDNDLNDGKMENADELDGLKDPNITVKGNQVSAITVFTRPVNPGEASGGGVTFFNIDNFGNADDPTKQGVDWWGPISPTDILTVLDVTSPPPGVPSFPNDAITSIKVQGNFLAVLFDGVGTTGTCEVFKSSDSNLRDNPIGRCHCGPFGWGCGDCLSSYIIIRTK